MNKFLDITGVRKLWDAIKNEIDKRIKKEKWIGTINEYEELVNQNKIKDNIIYYITEEN